MRLTQDEAAAGGVTQPVDGPADDEGLELAVGSTATMASCSADALIVSPAEGEHSVGR